MRAWPLVPRRGRASDAHGSNGGNLDAEQSRPVHVEDQARSVAQDEEEVLRGDRYLPDRVQVVLQRCPAEVDEAGRGEVEVTCEPWVGGVARARLWLAAIKNRGTTDREDLLARDETHRNPRVGLDR